MPNKLNNDARSNIGSLHQPQAPQKSVPPGSQILVNGKTLTITLTPPSNRVGGQSPANRRSVPKKPNSAAASQPEAANSAVANQPEAANSAVANQPEAAQRDKGLADAKVRRLTKPAQMPPGMREHRSTMQKIGRGIVMVAGGLVGGAIGAAVGFIAGTATAPVTGPVGAVAGTVLGSAAGATIFGLGAGAMFDKLCGGAPVDPHLREALAEMKRNHVELTPTQQQRFSQLSNKQVGELLHLPRPRSWRFNKQFGKKKIAPEVRLQIRASVMHLYAKTNDLQAAKILKEVLIDRAKAGQPVHMDRNRINAEEIGRAAQKLGLSQSDLTYENYMADLPDTNGNRASSGKIAAITHLALYSEFASEISNFVVKVKTLQTVPLNTSDDAAKFRTMLKELRDECVSKKAEERVNISDRNRRELLAALGETPRGVDDSKIDSMTLHELQRFQSTDRDGLLTKALSSNGGLVNRGPLKSVKDTMPSEENELVIEEAPQSERQAPEVQKRAPQVQNNSDPMLYGGPEFKALVKDLGIRGDIPDAMIEGPHGPVSVQQYLSERTGSFVKQLLPHASNPERAKLAHLRYAFAQAAEMIEKYSPPDGVKDVPAKTRTATAAMLRAASQRAAEKLGAPVEQNDRIGGQQPAPPADDDDIKRADIDMEEEVHNAEPADEEIEKPGSVEDASVQERVEAFARNREENERLAEEQARVDALDAAVKEEASESDTKSEVSAVEEASNAEEPEEKAEKRGDKEDGFPRNAELLAAQKRRAEELESPSEREDRRMEELKRLEAEWKGNIEKWDREVEETRTPGQETTTPGEEASSSGGAVDHAAEERRRMIEEVKRLAAEADQMVTEFNRRFAEELEPDGAPDSDNDLETSQGPVETADRSTEERRRRIEEAERLVEESRQMLAESKRILADDPVADGAPESDNDLGAPQGSVEPFDPAREERLRRVEEAKRLVEESRQMLAESKLILVDESVADGAPDEDDDDIKPRNIDTMSEVPAPREAEEEIEKLGGAPAVEPPSTERIQQDLAKQKILVSEVSRILEELEEEEILQELNEQRQSMHANAPDNELAANAARALDMAAEALLSFADTAKLNSVEDWQELDNSLAIQAEKLRLAHGMMKKEFEHHASFLELPRIVAEITNLRARLN